MLPPRGLVSAFVILVAVATPVGTVPVYLELEAPAGDHGMPASVGRAQELQVIGSVDVRTGAAFAVRSWRNRRCRYAHRMCRNIHTLHNYDPPATADEIRGAALQYVRKIGRAH